MQKTMHKGGKVMKKVKKILKTALCITLICAMLLTSMGAYSGLKKNVTYDYDPEDYIHYKFTPNKTMTKNCFNTNDSNIVSRIDETINFVESLNLTEMGHKNIEEGCIDELTEYKENGIILDSYTVLVPRVASTKTYIGTMQGKDYYSEYISESDFRIDIEGDKKNSSNEELWDSWMLGLASVLLSVLDDVAGIAFTMISATCGGIEVGDVAYDSYNKYVAQYTNVKTLAVCREEGVNRFSSYGYKKQVGDLRVNMYFCPVGDLFDDDHIFIGTVFEGEIDLTSDVSTLLNTIRIYIDRRGCLTDMLIWHLPVEVWE